MLQSHIFCFKIIIWERVFLSLSNKKIPGSSYLILLIPKIACKTVATTWQHDLHECLVYLGRIKMRPLQWQLLGLYGRQARHEVSSKTDGGYGSRLSRNTLPAPPPFLIYTDTSWIGWRVHLQKLTVIGEWLSLEVNYLLATKDEGSSGSHTFPSVFQGREPSLQM